MTTSTDVYWSVLDDAGLDVPLQTYAYNIDTWGGDKQSVPSLRGSDVTIPFAPGDYWVAKQPDSRTISLGMWVIGATESGNIPASGSSRQVFEENWRALRKLLWTPGRQITLIKRFRDFDTGTIIVAKALAQFSGGLTPTMNGTQRAQFVVQLNLADPFFYGEEESIELSRPTKVTNYAPSLYGPTTPVEVRRNLCNDPLALTPGDWGGNRATVTASAGEIVGTVNAVGYFPRIGVPAAVKSVAAGETVTISSDVGSGSLPVRGRVAFYSDSGGTVQVGAGVDGSAVASGRVTLSAVVPAGAITMRVEFGCADNTPVGEVFSFSKPLVERNSPNPYSYFDGSTMDESMSQPEDFRVRWVGAVNASESVMEGERVAWLTAVNCAAIVSSRDGGPAVRLIPTGASSDSYAQLSIPSVAQASGTVIGTVHLDAALTGTLSSASRRIWTATPVTQSDQPANEAGSYPVRHAVSGLTSSYVARLFHGGTLGSGDVWWTDIGLYEGDYDGPWFDGNSEPFIYSGHLVTPEWDGTPGDSTSSILVPPDAIDVKGDADTTKISITLNGPITNFEMKNNSQNKILSLTYSKEVDSTPVLIDIPKFSSFEGATKTTGYIDNLGDNFWMILRSGVNNITVDYDGAGSVVLKYKPAYF